MGCTADWFGGNSRFEAAFVVCGLLGWTAPRHRVPDLGCLRWSGFPGHRFGFYEWIVPLSRSSDTRPLAG
jgi:hypothetical protein